MLATLAAEKKNHLKPSTSSSIFPTHAGKGQIPHSQGTEDSQLPVVCPGEGRELKFRLAY